MAAQLHFTTQYALDCLEGKRVVGNMERLACLRHLHDLARAGELPAEIAQRVKRATKSPVPKRDPAFAEWTFDSGQADFVAVEWFASLNHVKGRKAGQPIKLIDSHRWEVSIIFGWVSRTERITRTNGRTVGVRRFRKGFVTEGRKNSKTTRGSGIGLYMMVGDMEQSPEVYCTAVDRAQAKVLYNSAKEMGEKSDDIRKRLKMGKYEFTHRERGGTMQAFSGEVKNKDAFNPSCAFVDEYHAHPTSEIYELLVTAQGQRAQPLLLVITTAGMDIESPCHHEYEYCKMILNRQTVNDRYFVMIRELDDGDDEHDPKNWIKANPLLMSDPIMSKEFQDAHAEAFGSKDPSKIRSFRVKKLNIWVHGNENSYMGDYLVPQPRKTVSKWDSCAVTREEFLKLTRGRLTVVGLDLSKKVDLTAQANIFVLADERLAVCAHGFIPEAAVDRHEHTDKIPYKAWAQEKWLTITDGDVTDYHRIQERMQACEKARGWKVHEICYDPYNATHFAIELSELGYITVEIAQWMKILSEPTKDFRELVASGRLVHDGSPLLRWAVGNAMQIVDTKENIMLSKKKAGDTRRIDPIAAIITAMVRRQSLKDADPGYLDDPEWGM
jgi:phage terminase large subunit-like protein